MAFEKIIFKNKQEPALSAENLNLLQDNIEAALNEVSSSVSQASALIDNINGEVI